MGLLIEPVWNRNSRKGLITFIIFKPLLLIEPVWNRNALESSAGILRMLTFNRTSMESKLDPVSVSRRAVGIQLLIEPVWNRNSVVMFLASIN